ncbi:MAG: hypothetical protein JWN24_48 [Phycisphaerales bacterium]|nr:hypothetical protein [Phycisphaerales bacterium]
MAPPPSAVIPLAKPAIAAYRRNLPHLQSHDKPLFVTFTTWQRWELPESVRGLVLEHCLHDHGIKLDVHGAVVMPDHVHMVFTARSDAQGNLFGLKEILGGMKGASAHRINRALGRKGHVWQDESFDHVLRSDENVREKVEYICQNPVRKGLVQRVDDYPWLWRRWVEGEPLSRRNNNVAQPPSAVSSFSAFGGSQLYGTAASAVSSSSSAFGGTTAGGGCATSREHSRGGCATSNHSRGRLCHALIAEGGSPGFLSDIP